MSQATTGRRFGGVSRTIQVAQWVVLSLLVSAFAGPSASAHDYPYLFAVKDHSDPNSSYDYKLWHATESIASSYRLLFLNGVTRWTITNSEVHITEKPLTDPGLDLKLTTADHQEGGNTVQAWVDYCNTGNVFGFHGWIPAQNPTMHYVVICPTAFDQLPGAWFCQGYPICQDANYFKKWLLTHEIGHTLDFDHTCTPFQGGTYCLSVDPATGEPTFSDQQYLETSPMWANCCVFKTWDNPPEPRGWLLGMPAPQMRPLQPLVLGTHDRDDLYARWPSNP